MEYLFPVLFVLHLLSVATCEKCNYDDCNKEGKMTCAFNEKEGNYSTFVNECAFKVYSICHSVELKKTPLKFCINHFKTSLRRMYGESCPLFCPSHYRPVCGMSKRRVYIYQTFDNGCFFDMSNCRGDEDEGYVEVPLHFCQRHLMKNIFNGKVIVSGMNDYRDYHEY